jgi:hypothetical protein
MRRLNRTRISVVLAILPIAVGYAQQQKGFNFETDAAGKAPAGFTSYATGGGPEGKWVVTEMSDSPSGKHVVEQTDADPTDVRFPVLIADNGEYADLDVNVEAKAISGKGGQGMGLVFRFRDPTSYYIVRANALEDNFRLYRMVNRKRLQFAGSSVKVAGKQWHTIRVVAKGDHITCWFDGQQLIDAHDKTYTTGKIGFWTKADSVTAFDDFTVTPLQ